MSPQNEVPTAPSPVPPVEIKMIPRIAVQAFCESQEIAELIERAGQDRRMSKAHVKVQMGGLAAALNFYKDSPTPNLIILETRDDRDKILVDLDELSEVCDPGTKVIIIGHVNDVLLYRELVRRGVSEYMVAPFELFDLIREIGEIYDKPDAPPLGRAVAFFGAKGGCGASTVAHNVGWAIANEYQNDVVLADLDLPWGTAGLDLNQDPAQGIGDALLAPERVDDVYLDRLLAKCADHLSLLSAPSSLERTWAPDEAAFEPIIDAVRGMVPVMVLDVPHLWTDWVRQTLRQTDEIVLVVSPDLANLRNAKNIVDQLRLLRPNDAAPRIVANMVGVPKRPEIKLAEFSKALELPILTSIPFEPQLFGTAANNGQMIAEIDTKSAIAESFRTIAQVVTGRSEIRKGRKTSLFERFLSRKAG